MSTIRQFFPEVEKDLGEAAIEISQFPAHIKKIMVSIQDAMEDPDNSNEKKLKISLLLDKLQNNHPKAAPLMLSRYKDQIKNKDIQIRKSYKKQIEENLSNLQRMFQIDSNHLFKISDYYEINVDSDFQQLQSNDQSGWYIEKALIDYYEKHRNLNGKMLIKVLFEYIKKRLDFKSLITKFLQRGIPLNIGTQQLMQYLLCYSDEFLRILIMTSCSIYQPLPLITPNIFRLNQSQNIVWEELGYIFEKRLSILNFKVGTDREECPKGITSFINNIFTRNFQNHQEQYLNDGTIEIQFDLNFANPQHIVVADAHGILDLTNLKNIQKMFDIFIIHVSKQDSHNLYQYQNLIQGKQCKVIQITHNKHIKGSVQTSANGKLIIEMKPYLDLQHQEQELIKQIILSNANSYQKLDLSLYLSNSQKRLDSMKLFQHCYNSISGQNSFNLEESYSLAYQFLNLVKHNIDKLHDKDFLPLSFYYQTLCQIKSTLQIEKDIDANEAQIMRRDQEKLEQLMQNVDKSLIVDKLLIMLSQQKMIGSSQIIAKLLKGTIEEATNIISVQRQEQCMALQQLIIQSKKERENQELLKNINSLQKIVDQKSKQIELLQFSQEHVHRELYLLSSQTSKNNKSKSLYEESYQQLCKLQQIQGQPFEVIDGNNLQFIHGVYDKIHENSNEDIIVVSVIGPQSSGKSLLLNFLFGTQFQSAAGRCTKGVYGYMISVKNQQTQQNKKILILDTEGIQAAEARDDRFDRRIVFFILSVSHIVLICSKSEMNSQMSEIIKLAAECQSSFLNEIIKPKVYIIMNMLTEINISAQSQCIQKLSESLLELEIEDSQHQTFTITQENVIMLPQAFNRSGDGLYVANKPSQDFAERLIPLKNKIIELTQNYQYKDNQKSSLKEWFNFAGNLWLSSDKISDLGKYKSIKDKKQERNLKDRIHEIIKQNFEMKKQQHDEAIEDIVSKALYSYRKMINVKQEVIYNQVWPQIEEYGQIIQQRMDEQFKHISQELGASIEIQQMQKKNMFRQQQLNIQQWNQYAQRRITEFVELKSSKLGNVKINEYIAEILQQNQQIGAFEADNLFEDKWKEIESELKQNQRNEEKIQFDTYAQVKTFYKQEIVGGIDLYDSNNEIQMLRDINNNIGNISNVVLQYWQQQNHHSLFFIGQEYPPSLQKIKQFQKKPNLEYLKNFNKKVLIKSKTIYLYDWKEMLIKNLINESANQGASLSWLYNLFSYFSKKHSFNAQNNSNTMQDLKSNLCQYFRQFNLQPKEILLNEMLNLTDTLNQIYGQEIKNKDELKRSQEMYLDKIKGNIEKYFKYYDHIPQLRQKANSISTSYINNSLQNQQYLRLQNGFQLSQFITQLKSNDSLLRNCPGMQILEEEEQLEINPKLQESKNDNFVMPNLIRYLNFLKDPHMYSIGLNDKCITNMKQVTFDLLSKENIIRNVELEIIKNIKCDSTVDKINDSIEQIIKDLKGDNIKKNEKSKYVQLSTNIIQNIVKSIKNIIEPVNEELEPLALQLSEYDVAWLHLLSQTYLTIIIYHLQLAEVDQIIQIFNDGKKTQRMLFIAKVTSNDVETDKAIAQQSCENLQNFLILENKIKMKEHFRQYLQSTQQKYKKSQITTEIIDKSIQYAQDQQRANSRNEIQNDLISQRSEESQTRKNLIKYLMQPKKYLNDQFKKLWKSLNDQKLRNIKRMYEDDIVSGLADYCRYLMDLLELLKSKRSNETSMQIFVKTDSNSSQDDQIMIDIDNLSQGEQNEHYIKDLCNKAMSCYFLQLLNKNWNNGNSLVVVDQQQLVVNSIFTLVEHSELEAQLPMNIAQNLCQSLQDEKISNLSTFIEASIESLKMMIETEYIITDDELIEESLQKFKSQFIGCQEHCPLCRRQCDVDHNEAEVIDDRTHSCNDGHQLQGFGGNKDDNDDAVRVCCGDIKDDQEVYHNDQRIKWEQFKTMIIKKKWEYQSGNEAIKQIDRMRQVLLWNYIGQEICDKYKQEQNIEIRFLPAAEKNFEKVHYVLLLDASGSMQGEWNSLVQSVDSFIGVIVADANLVKNSKMTVITYSDNASTCFTEQVPNQQLLRSISYVGSGTNFQDPLVKAYEIINQSLQNYDRHVICFMSDGQAPYPIQAIQTFTLNNQMMKKIIFTAVYYGHNNNDYKILKKISDAMNGQIKQALTPQDLQKEFQLLIPNIYDN
eukprot:403335263